MPKRAKAPQFCFPQVGYVVQRNVSVCFSCLNSNRARIPAALLWQMVPYALDLLRSSTPLSGSDVAGLYTTLVQDCHAVLCAQHKRPEHFEVQLLTERAGKCGNFLSPWQWESLGGKYDPFARTF